MLNNPLLLGDSSAYQIANSLRFRASNSAYLSRTPAGAGSQTTWSWSGWVKRGALGGTVNLFHGETGATTYTVMQLSSDNLIIDVRNGGAVVGNKYTTAVYRDPSAWMHIVFVWDTTNGTAADRIRVYVNGVRVTSFGTSNDPTSSAVSQGLNGANAHRLGSGITFPNYFDGYLSEINFIDGQALTPNSFGETNSDGVWVPKKYSGTYGTNGFYLPFNDGSNLTNLCLDRSGNSNNWTASGVSLTAGVTYDWMVDTPTNNYAVLNPLDGNTSTLSGANLDFVTLSTGNANTLASLYVSTGKWYWEIATSANANSAYYGIRAGASGYYVAYYGASGNKDVNGTSSAYGAAYTNGDAIGVALDMDAGTITFYKNNASQGSITIGNSGPFAPWIADGASSISVTGSINFGQRPFAYTPPTGFKALCTANLPAVAITNPKKHFDVSLRTGTGVAGSATGFGFRPDLVWVKARNTASWQHTLTDSVRGTNAQLFSALTIAEETRTDRITAFNADGYSFGTYTDANNSGDTFVNWLWKANGAAVTNNSGSISSQVSANATAGFSIVTYTGTGANATVGHGLGVAPKMVIVKSRSAAATGWPVYHASQNATPQAGAMYLHTTSAYAADATAWNSAAPTSSVFSIGTNSNINVNTQTQVAYCFAEIPGYSRIGSYTGNGSTDGPFLFCGFRPRWVMVKRTDAASSWSIHDSGRQPANNPEPYLLAESSAAEADAGSAGTDLLSSGFKIRSAGTQYNASGGTYIFLALAESPFGGSNTSPALAR